MKPIKSLLVLAILCAPALAAAQGYYRGRGNAATTAPGGFHNRTGRVAFGIGVGLGGMHDGGSAITSCDNCDVEPFAFEGDFHIGGMLSPRFALMFEAQGNLQMIHANRFDEDTYLTQGAGLFAAQFWIIPQLWVKGGLGFANLQVDDTYFIEDFGTGGALLLAAGVEVMSARNFAFNIQGRLLQTAYNSLDDKVTSGTIGVGVDWY